MDREQLKAEFRAAAIARAPELGAELLESLINADRVQSFFDRMEQKHKHGLVAIFRRWRGRKGLDERDRADLEMVIKKTVDKYRK
jgi:hypothetical protein